MVQPKTFFVLRQPTYSLDKLFQFHNQLATQSLANLLRLHYADPLAQQALFVASPALYERFSRWLAGESLPEEDKLLVTLHKYLVRMCTRPTPYGLFAGCTVGTFGPHTQLRAGGVTARGDATLRTHTRLDMDCLMTLCQWLIQRPAIRSQLRLFPNSSLYRIGATLRYIEQQREDSQRHYFISAVDANHYLNAVLEAARPGATIGALVDELTALGADGVEAADFIEQLIESQLLRFEIEPTLTQLHYLDQLTSRIASLTDTAGETAALRQLGAILQHPDRLTAYAGARQWFPDYGIQAPTADVVQVDTFFDNPSLFLGERPLQQLRRQLEKLMVLNQAAHCSDLEEFKRRFYTRYEDEEIPLAMALDSEVGVGYGSASTLGVGYAPLVDDLNLGPVQAPQTITWDWWQALVMDKYAAALRTGPSAEVVLTDDDLASIRDKQTAPIPAPDSFFVFGSLLAPSTKALDEGDFQFHLMACKGPSAVNLLSRFGEGHPELAQQIRQCAAAEEAYHPDVLIAEIVHLPENRVGNILIRPTIHQYEIPYMGQSSVDPDFQIPLADLMVSVRQNEVILRSKRFNQRVIPRLTNAHNFSQGLPIYRFLCDLQAQDAHLNVAWNWGVLRNQTYLPRVRYHNIILSRATWQLACSELTPDNPLRLVAQLTAAGLPEQFVLVQGDNELLISMHVPHSLALLAQEIRRQQTESTPDAEPTGGPHVRLAEFLPMPNRCPLRVKAAPFTHELIIPFSNNAARPLPGLSRPSANPVQRRFSVGSEWFYLKVYTGEKTSDTLLVNAIYPAVQQLLKTQIIQEFFFIRYKDTDPHLRLRFRGNPHLEFYHHVVRVMEKALHESVESGVVHHLKVDTYQRELERYGMETMALCETLFHHDSLSTLTFLARTGDEFDENMRVAFAIRKIDRLLTGAGLGAEACQTVMGRLKAHFFEEFGGTAALRHQLNEKYRRYRPLLDEALAECFPIVDDPATRPDDQNPTLRQLATALTDGDRLHRLISDLIHMLVNRLFPSKQRAYELVLYHCLARHYDSVRARQATEKTTSLRP